MANLAWMLLAVAASPVMAAVPNRDAIEHEACHGYHASLRQQFGRPTVYLGGGLAACLDDPPVSLADVARSVPTSERGPQYQLYLVTAQRAWNWQPTYLLDEGWSYVQGTRYYVVRGRASDAAYSAERARELTRYAGVLLRLARATPDYDCSQLAAILEYQGLWVGSLSSAGVAAAPPNGASSVAKPSALEAAGRTEPNEKASAEPRHTPADDPWASTVVIHWTASWCGPCRQYAPLWPRLASRRGVTVLSVDVDKPLPTWAPVRPARIPQVEVWRNRARVGHWQGAGAESQIEEACQ